MVVCPKLSTIDSADNMEFQNLWNRNLIIADIDVQILLFFYYVNCGDNGS